MGMDKQPKNGNYVGGFLQLFDWKAKSRKKLFTSKSDVPEQSKHKKRCDGNFPTTRLQMMDEDDIAAPSSIRGGSDFSCASSVNDEDFYTTKPPGVVARLMGLDSLPKSLEPNSTPLFDTQSLYDAYYKAKNIEYQDPPIMHSGTLQETPICRDTMPNYTNRPIEKFQSEILPPRSAKSIPVTHHKLLSPIKSVNFIPSKQAAHIMEAAAKIIENRPQVGSKTKLPSVGSSSAPLKVKDLKEKAQKRSKVSQVLQRPSESSTAAKNLKGQSINKSWNGPIEAPSLKILPDIEESSVSTKSKGKSISLALQAKANVQKREGLGLKETREPNLNLAFKSQPMTQKSGLKRTSAQSGSSVLRPNNQKQNCMTDRGKSPLKQSAQSGKDSSCVRQRNSSKASGSPKINSRKLGSEFKDDKREATSSSSSEKVTRKKRSIDGNYHSENMQTEKSGKGVQSCDIVERKNIWEHGSEKIGSDVISFTFTAPMTRSGQNSNIFTGESRNKRALLSSSDGMSASKFSYVEKNVTGGDNTLSTLLEQKLKELTLTVELSQKKARAALHDTDEREDRQLTDNLEVLEVWDMPGTNSSQARKFFDPRLPSPVSALELSSLSESCNSTDTTDSYYSTQGGKQCSSTQAREVGTLPFSTFLPVEHCTELSDSASSVSATNAAKRRETTIFTKEGWELEYIKEMLHYIEPMFKNFASGRTTEIISPTLFDQIETQKVHFSIFGLVTKMDRRVLFDSASECLQTRFRQYVAGGYSLWDKGVSTGKRKEKIAEEVYKEVSSLSGLGDSMVDEFVDKDMSGQYGRWLDFDVEAFELGVQIESSIVNSLIDELVASMLVR